jgi:thymidine phosphorylase
MSQPLGRAVGHVGEVQEAFTALRPDGRRQAPPDLVAVTEELTARMLATAGVAADLAAGREAVRAAWDGGAAQAALQRWVRRQGGSLDWEAADLGLNLAPVATEVTAPHAGWLDVRDCRDFGLALADLGGARLSVEDPVDLEVGIDWLGRVGAEVAAGEPLAAIRTHDASRAETARRRLAATLVVASEPVPAPPTILASPA